MFLFSQLVDSFIVYDIFTLVLLMIVVYFARQSKGFFSFEQKIYLCIAISLGITVIFDLIMAFVNEQTFTFAREINYVASTLYYVFTPLCMVFWIFFVDYSIHKSKRRFKRFGFLYSLPFLANLVLCFVNIKTGLFFKITSDNVYVRGDLFYLSIGVAILYFFYTLGIIIMNQIVHKARIRYSFILILIPPLVGCILQGIFYGLSLNWIGITLSFVFLLIHTQSKSLSRDYLTDLYNRRQLVKVLNSELKRTDNGYLSAIMLDIDKFKSINDSYGHTMGDDALKMAGVLLKKSCKKTDSVFRYAGDEFVILLDSVEKEYVNTVINNIHFYASEFNAKTDRPYSITFSLGFITIAHGEDYNYLDVLRTIDEKMYADKGNDR